MKKLGKLLVFLLLAGVLFGCSKEEAEKEFEIYYYDADACKDTEFKLENDELIFELDKTTTQFTVTQKSTGKVWYSNPVGGADDPLADGASKKLLQSTIVIEYSNVNDLRMTLNSFEHSTTNQNYTLEKTEDSIRVNYSIGKIAKTYYIPPAVPEERMMEFYNKMDNSQQKRVNNGYTKIDINDLLPTDNKDELLAMYPMLETTPMYVVRDSTKDHQKEKLQEIFAEVGYTEADYESDVEKYAAATASEKPLFNVSVVYRINGDHLDIEVPNESIKYKSDYPVTKLSLLPYFGCGSTEDTGYLFVPEGSGAIIDFNNGKTDLSAYYAQLYGWDYGTKRDVVVDETRASFPVFGIANGDSSFIGVIDSFSTIATIQADISGKRHSYNYAYASYEMVHTSKMDISKKSDNTILAFENNIPEGSIKQSYYFMEGTDYVDMAERYRKCLMDKYPELQKTTDSELPVAVEFIAAVDRVKQILGIPVSRPEVLTSFKDAKSILEEMIGDGYTNLSVRYTGWMNGGINHTLPKDIDLTSGMGGKSAFNSLISFANENGIDLYLSGRVQNAYESNVFDGFMKSRDAAKYLSREVVEIPEFSHIWFSDLRETRAEHHFLLRPSVCVSLMQNLADYAKEHNAGVGFEDVGYLLSGDYNKKRTEVRESAMNMQTEKLAEIKNSGVPILLTNGNDYVLPYATLITDMDLEGKDYLTFDRRIPFYEIAIHGLVSYTGDAINLGDNPVDMILKSAETGAGLSFAFIKASTAILQDTEYMDFFGATYDDWKERAKEYYLRYKEEMAGLNNLFITDHKILADGVTATTYEDNTVVYVNASEYAYSDETVTIPAKDYLVERSGN